MSCSPPTRPHLPGPITCIIGSFTGAGRRESQQTSYPSYPCPNTVRLHRQADVARPCNQRENPTLKGLSFLRESKAMGQSCHRTEADGHMQAAWSWRYLIPEDTRSGIRDQGSGTIVFLERKALYHPQGRPFSPPLDPSSWLHKDRTQAS